MVYSNDQTPNNPNYKEYETIMQHTLKESKRFDSVFEVFCYVQKCLGKKA